jgi:hypothetical protein
VPDDERHGTERHGANENTKMGEGHIPNASQEDRILRLLEARDGWVSAVELSKISLQYCRAVNGLRRRGVRVENRVEMRGRTRCGYYRIARPIVQAPLLDMQATRWADPEEA